MFLKRLQLTNFRNYKQLDLSFDDKPTILLGNNAAGKSNLLESIYLLSTTKSIRVEKEEELILNSESFARVEGIVENGKEETDLVVITQKKLKDQTSGKKLLVNGVGRRTVDFLGNLPAVIFYPSDINMVTGSPSLRRWHLDLALAQIDREYKKSLTLYEQLLTSRNRVLKRIKEGSSRPDELLYWTEELLKQSEIISRKRTLFFEFINGIDSGLGKFHFKYSPSFLTKERLENYRDSEIAAATTLIGPHRDDFSLLQDVRNLAHFGSRGEQRTATLAFKLAQLEFMAQVHGRRPLLLLDDIFSELDGSHRGKILEIVPKQQTIIATVELENIPKSFLDSARILNVEHGEVHESLRAIVPQSGRIK